MMFDFSGIWGYLVMLVCGILWRTLEDFSYPGIKHQLVAALTISMGLSRGMSKSMGTGKQM